MLHQSDADLAATIRWLSIMLATGEKQRDAFGDSSRGEEKSPATAKKEGRQGMILETEIRNQRRKRKKRETTRCIIEAYLRNAGSSSNTAYMYIRARSRGVLQQFHTMCEATNHMHDAQRTDRPSVNYPRSVRKTGA